MNCTDAINRRSNPRRRIDRCKGKSRVPPVIYESCSSRRLSFLCFARIRLEPPPPSLLAAAVSPHRRRAPAPPPLAAARPTRAAAAAPSRSPSAARARLRRRLRA